MYGNFLLESFVSFLLKCLFVYQLKIASFIILYIFVYATLDDLQYSVQNLNIVSNKYDSD